MASIIRFKTIYNTHQRYAVLFILLLVTNLVQAEILDESNDANLWFNEVSMELDALGIDLIHNLNHRSLARGRIERPRLGVFPDIPQGEYPTSEEILVWEQEFNNSDIGAIAFIRDELSGGQNLDAYADFSQAWLTASDPVRLFVSFHSSDSNHADNLAAVLRQKGYPVLVFHGGSPVAQPGQLFATTGQRMAIDSREARRYKSSVTEFEYLGERVKRNSNSLFNDNSGALRRIARNEPSVFLKTTLGDEYEASTIEEIIVPGGIALGEEAELPIEFDSLQYREGRLWLQDKSGELWSLPEEEMTTLKALFDFVQRSESIQSDAIVDIDADRKVKISSQFRDTDVGYNFVELDTQPFNFVRGLRVTKSVMIDTEVEFVPDPDALSLSYNTVYEVRFLSADNMRIAQTRVALEYQYSSLDSTVSHSYSWGRDLNRLDDNLDYAGLGISTSPLANYAAWTALFRKVKREPIRFLDGRYDFMKLDKAGRDTPSRF